MAPDPASAAPLDVASDLSLQPQFIESPVEGYIFLRLVLAIGLLAVASANALREPGALLALPFEVSAIACLAMGISAVLVRRSAGSVGFIWAQMALDTIFATAMVSVSGGPESSYAVIYFMSVVAAARLIGSRGVLFVTAINVGAFVTLNIAGLSGLLGWGLEQDLFFLYTQVLVRVFGLLLVGFLSTGLVSRGMLSAQIRRNQSLQREHAVLLDRLSLAILSVEGGRVTAANGAAERLGLSVGEPPGFLEQREEEDWEQRLDIDGEERWVSCRRRPLAGGGDVYIVDDITRLRAMEAQVKRDERLAAVGRVAASLAHEIRNPLASLSGSVQLLGERDESPLHRIVLREVQRLNDLVEEFLQASRPLQVTRIWMDLGQMLGEVVEAFRNDPRCRGLREVALELSDAPQILADPARLRQVVWNLLVNAVNATEAGGHITVTLQPTLGGLRLDVRDDGVGIEADQLLRIFDPFYTTRAGGTGLGLANVDRIVRAHGGEVKVESAVGEGTVFMIWLPLSEGELADVG